MPRNQFDIGDVVELQATFTDKNGAPVDPGTVKVTFKRPSGVETTLTYGVDEQVTKASPRIYTYSTSLDQSGIWYYRWQGTGMNAAAAVGEFEVRKTPFTP
jgi:hypothetical protein